MDTKKIRELIGILEGSSLNYMEVSEGEFHLKLGKSVPAFAPGTVGNAGAAGLATGAPVNAGAVGLAAGAPVNAGAVGLAAGTASNVGTAELAPVSGMAGLSAASATGGTAVTSPMVGVFYAASSPEGEPFVQKGQKVTKGQVLCIIEAMKLMNEITAEQDGVIAEICVKDGDIVEFGQPLFYME